MARQFTCMPALRSSTASRPPTPRATRLGAAALWWTSPQVRGIVPCVCRATTLFGTGHGKSTLQRTLSKPKERRSFLGFSSASTSRAGASSSRAVAQVVAQQDTDKELERKQSPALLVSCLAVILQGQLATHDTSL